jgi:hypothetical protein
MKKDGFYAKESTDTFQANSSGPMVEWARQTDLHQHTMHHNLFPSFPESLRIGNVFLDSYNLVLFARGWVGFPRSHPFAIGDGVQLQKSRDRFPTVSLGDGFIN